MKRQQAVHNFANDVFYIVKYFIVVKDNIIIVIIEIY